jgi:hypothetical protein
MKNNLVDYINEYNQVKTSPGYEFGQAQEFVSQLLSLPPEERFKLLPLFKQIEEDAFIKGIEIPNLNYSNLENDKKIWEDAVKKSPGKRLERRIESKDDFNKVLQHFFTKYATFFLKIKGYFVFKLDSTNDTNTRVIVLYDENFNKHPELDTFDVNDEILVIKKEQIKDFLETLKKDPELLNNNYLCVLLVASNLRNNEIVLPHLESLLNSFSNSNFISLKKVPLGSSNDYEIKDTSEGIDTIKSYSDKVFNNRALSFEEELIIKKVFDGNEMILDYKFLKSGNSGSKVIEIQPLRGHHPEMGRFVVKFDVKNSERKIRKEKTLFRQYITDFLVQNYTAEYEETMTHEAIRYNYASSDSKKDAYPFSKLINDHIKGKKDYQFSLSQVIEELFNCDPYKKWNTKNFPVLETVKNLYSAYIKSEDKVLKSISLIEGIDISKVNDIELVKNYKFILDHSIRTNRKICHGDLHSENFFKDEKGVYLIDFGWTDKHHSLIDHATLECSLKYKHLPFYVPIDELISYESALLSIDSFSNKFDLSMINRPIVYDIFRIITQIREKAKEHMLDDSNALEYLISLFIINFRQIQYPDLNQRYAMISANILSKEIIKQISK